MCGRAKLETDVSEIRIAFRIPPEYPTPNFAPSWNVAPTDNLPIVRYDPKAGSRTLDLMRWGLVPYWAKDIKIGFSTINAMADRSMMALAGLWETWRSPAKEIVRSFTIVTTTPNELCADLHNRMPVI